MISPILSVLEAVGCAMLLGLFFAACCSYCVGTGCSWCFSDRRKHTGEDLEPWVDRAWVEYGVDIQEPPEPSTRNVLQEYNLNAVRRLRDEIDEMQR